MRLEIVDTVSKRRSITRSARCARLRNQGCFNSPSSNAASISKSWMCNHALAPASRAANQATGAQKNPGATTNTTRGCQQISFNTTGILASAKLARCSRRVSPLRRFGIQIGQR